MAGRPIHQLHRNLRENPDENEPSHSYEQESFLMTAEGDDVEDEFYRRLSSHRGVSGSSFWRSTSQAQETAQPNFSSMPMTSGDEEKAANGRFEEEKGSAPSPGAMLSGSWSSTQSTGSGKNKQQKKELSKQLSSARRLKIDAQSNIVDSGHLLLQEDPAKQSSLDPVSLSRNTSTASADGSLLSSYSGKAHTSSVLLGKSSSLIFPTGVDHSTTHREKDDAANDVSESDRRSRRKVNLLLDQCETVRFPFKKKLMLENLHLRVQDIPLKDLVKTSLGNSLHKLSLAGNPLTTIPDALVQNLPALRTLDLSQCDLVQLPTTWNLPQLKRLNLSHNRLTEFPDESMLEGLRELQELNMYGNKVAEITIPHNPRLLSKLETLNLGYNELTYLPDELDQLSSLKVLKAMNNLIEKVPMRVCDMDSIRTLDVSSNPVIQPPLETCDRGICSMKRYYHCLRLEEQTKQKALEEVQKKLSKQKKKEDKNKFRKMKFFSGPAKTPSPVATSKSSLPPTAVPRAAVAPVVPSKPQEGRDVIASTKIDQSSPLVDADAAEKIRSSSDEGVFEEPVLPKPEDDVTINDTLKVIFVGMAMAGKTSMIKRLIEGKDAVIPKRDERTVGVDIYEWDPKDALNKQIELGDPELAQICGDVPVKFSVWDFAGQHVYHATHELFFSSRALYVLVWDMGATNRDTQRRKSSMMEGEQGAFKLAYDSSDDEDDDDFMAEEEARRADRALERDIDDKVQFWVDCIQSSAPGAAILPVASFDDYFASGGSEEEAIRRCNFLKERLLKHEERRIIGIKQRLKEYYDDNRANDEAAMRLRKLICPYVRPKLIFGDSPQNSVVRVSGTKYTGFDRLTGKIVDIATGRDKAGWKYPIFRGHVGARIPRMRLEVREAVRELRHRFKVVEWGYFLNSLRDRNLYNVEDISDALHFLTNIGELSYFGNVLPDPALMNGSNEENRRVSAILKPVCVGNEIPEPLLTPGDLTDNDDFDDDDDEDKAILSIDDTSATAPSTNADGSLSTLDDTVVGGLSQFVFLNPRWLVAAVACILRHDLDREIRDTRRLLSHTEGLAERGDSIYEANLNCPIITAEDACLLWQAKKFTKKALERALEHSNNMTVTPFDFLQRVLVRFGVFVPIDLSIESAFLGGREYATLGNTNSTPKDITVTTETLVAAETSSDTPKFFFLPSLLGPGEPSEVWTYKNTDSWKTTLCHSILFPDGVPPGLMERITAAVLSSTYSVSTDSVPGADPPNRRKKGFEGKLRVKEILCWRTAFFVKLGMEIGSENGELKESIVEIFTHLTDRDSHLCVGSDAMGAGMRRLVVSGKGQVGDGGRKIWMGGYLLVIQAVRKVMNEYGGLEFEKQAFCPECLSKKAVSQASSWDWTVLRHAAQNGEDTMRCHHGHRVDTRLIAGPCDSLSRPRIEAVSHPSFNDSDPIIPVNDLLRGVVVVGLWDGKTRKIVRVGSGFIVDKKRGLIVTASHTLMNIWGDKSSPFGENYYGLREGKVAVGVIPRNSENGDETRAVFRYFAKIVAKDPSIDEEGTCHSDVCVLKIVTRMENDVEGNGEGCGDQPERLLMDDLDAMKREKLQQLKVTEKCELDEQVRILGYNQGGEGLLGPGQTLNQYVDFARGYVCKKFATGEDTGGYMRHRFKPREEIVVICPTIGGHSGGPCVNQQGEVIGILSRADPAENHRCYLVPASEWKALVKQSKKNAQSGIG